MTVIVSNYDVSQKKDLRARKTERALIKSMLSLLNEFRFTKLTVDRLCREGQLSRATFYSHFTDKYALLEFGLLSSWTYKATELDTNEELKETVNKHAIENKKIISNLLIDADHQTLEILQNFLCKVLEIESEKRIDGNINQKNIVVSNLYIGGIVNYLIWQVRNNFPPDVPVMNDHSYAAIKKLWDWAREQ